MTNECEHRKLYVVFLLTHYANDTVAEGEYMYTPHLVGYFGKIIKSKRKNIKNGKKLNKFITKRTLMHTKQFHKLRFHSRF